jgi:ligand-binding sensor domain-containing protein
MGAVRPERAVLRILELCTCFALLAPSELVAQRFSFRVYAREAGLGDPVVSTIVQDETGFLWVGTEGGLFRYDGAEFKPFSTNVGLKGAYVESLHHTPDGTLWALTRDALARKEGTRFVSVPFPGVLNAIGANRLASDRSGALYVAANWGLVSVKKSAGDYRSDVVARTPTQALTADDNGTIWVACGVELCRLEGSRLLPVGTRMGLPARRWQFLQKGAGGKLWLADDREVFEVSPGAQRTARRTGRLSPIWCLYVDSSGRVYAGTARGLAVLGDAGWQTISSDNGLPSSGIPAAFRDREGSLWMGVEGIGLARWMGGSAWEGWTEREGLPDNVVWQLNRAANGALWVGTNNGMVRMITKSGALQVDPSVHAVPNESVRGIAEDTSGHLWIGSFTTGLAKLSPAGQLLARYGEEYGLPVRRARGILYDSRGQLWASYDSGLYRVRFSGARLQAQREVLRPDHPDDIFFQCIEGPAGVDLGSGYPWNCRFSRWRVDPAHTD